jgi:VWFA-related protein
MKKVTGKTFPLLFALIGLSLAYSQGQHSTKSDEPIKLSAELVLVDAEVLSKRTGQPVAGLRKEDFILFEDGVKQQITHFSQDKLPLSVVLLVDISDSVSPIMDQIRDGTWRALQQLRPEDEVALMAFTLNVDLLQDFTTNRQLIGAKIEGLKSPRVVGTFISEAVYQAARYLRKASTPNGRRVVIAITDNFSLQRREHPHSEKETLHELHEVGAAVYGVIYDWRITVEGVMDKHKILILEEAIRKKYFVGDVRVFAEKTGGMVVETDKGEIAAKLAAVIDRLRTRYCLGYVPRNPRGDGKFRKIKVEISPEVEKKEGAVAIIAREGYYAPRSSEGRDRR